MKLVFTPFSIALGLVAGIIGRKIFEQVWGLIDEDEPPHPQHRETGGFVKLLAALVVEGAVFRLVPGLAHPRAPPRGPRRPPRRREADRRVAGRRAPGTGVDRTASGSPARVSGRSHPPQKEHP